MQTYNDFAFASLKYMEPEHQFVLAFNNYRLDNKLVYEHGLYDHFMSKTSKLKFGIFPFSMSLPHVRLCLLATNVIPFPFFYSDIGNDVNLMGAINNISFTYPSISLLTQPHEIDETKFCDEFNLPAHCIGRSQCPCIHRIKVDRGALVELILVDESDGDLLLAICISNSI